ncbi:MAG: PAS domain S-box protein [Pseudomonadota bacterium]
MNQTVTFASLERGVIDQSMHRILRSAADVSLVLDEGDLMRELAAPGGPQELDLSALEGRPLGDLLTADSAVEMQDLLQQTRETGSSRPLDVVLSPDVLEGQVLRFSAHSVADAASVLLVGRFVPAPNILAEQLACAQISQDRDALRRRESESRYRILFQSAPEAIMFINLATGRIDDVNANAADLIGQPADALKGRHLTELVAPSDREKVEQLLDMPAANVDPQRVPVALAPSGDDVLLIGQVFRAIDQPQIVLRIRRLSGEAPRLAGSGQGLAARLLQKSADPIALTDVAGAIYWTNEAFRTLIPDASGPIVGRQITDLLDLSQSAFRGILRVVDSQGRTRIPGAALGSGSSILRGTDLDEADVVVVAVPGDDPLGYGLIIQRQLNADKGVDPSPQRANGSTRADIDAIADLVGRAPMKDLVRETAEAIERACIETALNLTNGNRAAAAEVLGLSRQSLYVKLRRFGFI